jgi:hypothetical protein
VKRKERWPLILWRGFLGLKTRFKFMFYFEFEFRKRRTIKRDTNSGMDETKCWKIFSKTKIIPITYDLSASYNNHLHTFSEPLRFFPEVPRCSQIVCWSSPVPGGFGFLPRGSGYWISRCCSRSEGIYKPLSPNGILLPPYVETIALAPLSLKHWLPPTWIQIQP